MAKGKGTSSKKAKQEYYIVAPEYFNSVNIGVTLAKDPKDLLGRTTVLNLTGKLTLQGTRIKFYVTDVKGDKANTTVSEQEVAPSVIKRLTRRRRSKIEVVEDVSTKDSQVVRVKTDVFTAKRATTTQRTAIRNALSLEVKNVAKEKQYSDFIQEVAYGKLSTQLLGSCRKVAPVKRIEVRKTELLSRPKPVITKPEEKEQETPAA